MQKRKKRRRELPITGILIGVVIVLLICVLILGWMLLRNTDFQMGSKQKAQTEAQLMGQTEVITEVLAETQTESDDEVLIESFEETELPADKTESETEAGEAAELITENVTDAEQELSEDTTEVAAESITEEAMEDVTETVAEELIKTMTEVSEESETELPVEKLVVAIDPGHQGNWVDMSDMEPNAPGSSEMKRKATVGTEGRFSGKAEFELNLEVSLILRDILEERGYDVIMTREDHDKAISNAERALMAYEEGGDIYVRIHANGSDNSGVSGALAMVPSPSNPYVGHLAEDSYLLGQCILDGYCNAAQFDSLGIQYYDNMTGINWSKLPVMILEMGFMTNENDDLRMANTEVQAMMAKGIADGIDHYFESKGMLPEEKVTVDPEEQARIDLLFEQLGENYLHASLEAGETWAVSVSDIRSGASGHVNGDVPMKSASVIKVFIMAAIYDRVCYPSSEDRRITIPEYYDGELKQLITDMITVSDNNASNTLIERLGGGNVQEGMAIVNQFCQENGYTNTSLGRRFLESNPTGDNFTSANDCTRLLQSIYEGTCVNAEASAKMLAYLRNQTRTWKIPAGISGTGAVTYNKTGELAGDYGDFVENDIAIVEDGDSAYVLSILTGNLRDNGNAMARISEISRMVYENR